MSVLSYVQVVISQRSLQAASNEESKANEGVNNHEK